MSTSTEVASVVRAGEGTGVQWGPMAQIRILGSAETTNRSFSVIEAFEQPGSAAPLHIHHGEAEAFYVVEGEIELRCGEQTVTASAGDFIYTPKDVAHTYAVVVDRPARVLMMFSRSGFESFFAEGGAPLGAPPAGPPDPEKMQRLFAKYQLEVLEPFGH